MLFGPNVVSGIKGLWARRKEVKGTDDLARIVEEVQNELGQGAKAEKTTGKAETPTAKVTPPPTVEEKGETQKVHSGPMFAGKKEGEKSAGGTDDNLESDKGSEGPPK